MIYLYSHDVGSKNRTGITKVGFLLFSALINNNSGFTLISAASEVRIFKELDSVKPSNLKSIKSILRVNYIKHPLKKLLAKILNISRFNIRKVYFEKNDTLILNHIEYDKEFLEFLKNCKAYKICWMHGTPEAYLNIEYTQDKIDFIVDCFQEMDLVIHLNEYSVNSWRKYGLNTPHRIIHNSVWPGNSPTVKESVESMDALIIGSITKRKGFDKLLEIADNEYLQDIRIGIIGKNPETQFSDQVLNHIKKLKNVNYYGSVENPQDFINSSKLIWCLSKGEGQSLALLESMAAGKIILSTEYPGIEDLIVEDSTGYIIKTGEITDFIKTTKEILGASKKLEYLEMNSKSHFQNKFSFEKFQKEINSLISEKC